MNLGRRTVLALAFLGQTAAAQLPSVTMSGSNTLRMEHYRVSGDMAAAPYSALGWQSFDEINLSGQYRASPFDQWRMQFAGVGSHSSYRTQNAGGTVERFALVREDGEGRYPYRLELGDVLGFYSLRTLQQSVKGGQIELQASSGAVRQSLVLTSGALGKPWRGFDNTPSDNILGASWVMEHASLGQLSANVVNSRRDAHAGTGALARNQTVLSLAAGKTLKHGFGQSTVEAEIAHFRGDHDGLTGVASGQARHDMALFGQVSGKNTAGVLDYRLRFERNGQDFRPRAAVVAADREARELHLGYRLPGGIQARGRFQLFQDSVESANPGTSRVAGVNLSGALLPFVSRALTGHLDASLQDAFNRDRSSDSTTQVLNLSMNHPLPGGLNGRFSASFNGTTNHVAVAPVNITRTLGLDLDLPVKVQGIMGNLSLGIQQRRVAPDSQEVYAPRLAAQLASGPHSLNLDWSLQYQNMLAPGAADVRSSTPNLSYRYQSGPHTLGLEYNYSARQPTPGLSTEGERIALFWTLNFDVPAKAAPPRPAAPRVAPIPSPAVPTSGADVPGFFALMPGMPLAQARQRLAAQGIQSGVELKGLAVFEAAALARMPQRQRLGLAHEVGEVDRLVLVLEVDNPADGMALLRQYEEVRRLLLDKLGNPADFLERGALTANLADGIRAGSFIRATDWRVPGGFVRLGLPQRLDGQVRMEVQFTRHALPPASQTRWSLEALR